VGPARRAILELPALINLPSRFLYENGASGETCTLNLPGKSRLLCVIELQKRDDENGGTQRTCTPCRFAGGTIPLAPGPGSLVRFAFHESSRAELHRQLSRLKRDASADWATGGDKSGIPGRSCTFGLPVRSRLLFC
jgi:hypothetical protein